MFFSFKIQNGEIVNQANEIYRQSYQLVQVFYCNININTKIYAWKCAFVYLTDLMAPLRSYLPHKVYLRKRTPTRRPAVRSSWHKFGTVKHAQNLGAARKIFPATRKFWLRPAGFGP